LAWHAANHAPQYLAFVAANACRPLDEFARRDRPRPNASAPMRKIKAGEGCQAERSKESNRRASTGQ